MIALVDGPERIEAVIALTPTPQYAIKCRVMDCLLRARLPNITTGTKGCLAVNNDFETWLTFAVGSCETEPLTDGGGEEGGWTSDDPSPTCPTMRGLQYDEVMRFFGLHNLTLEQFRAFVTRTRVAQIAMPEYWRRYHVDLLPAGPNVLYMDGAFNGGGVENLQTALNVLFAAGLRADNELGPMTLAAMQRYLPICNPEALIRAYANASEIRYRSLGRFSEFGVDWLARLGHCQQLALKLADNKPPSAA